MIELLYDFLIVIGLIITVSVVIAIINGEKGIWWLGTVIILPIFVLADYLQRRKEKKN